MIITQPNDFVAEVHDRMPVVLEARDIAGWLNEGAHAVLRPAGNDVLQRLARIEARWTSTIRASGEQH